MMLGRQLWALSLIGLSIQSQFIHDSKNTDIDQHFLELPKCATGTRDGLYSYLDQIGEGSSSSAVLKAQSSTTDKLVAIKVFDQRDNNVYIEEILSEFDLASQLQHPNIIQSLELRQEDESTWLYVMEYCHTPLIKWLLSQSPSEDAIEDVFVQILSAVRYLHSRGIAHRDIKIHNVVMCSDGRAKLIDFGEAVIMDSTAEGKVADFVGTYEYIAPEMYDTEPYDPLKADIWALGILFCALSLQDYPWHKARVSTNSAFVAFVSDPYDTLLTRLPTKSRHIVGLMLEIESERRVDIDGIFADPWIQVIYAESLSQII